MTITTLFYGLRRKTNNRMQHVILSIIFYHDYHPSHLLTIMEINKNQSYSDSETNTDTSNINRKAFYASTTDRVNDICWNIFFQLSLFISYLCWYVYAPKESVVLNCIWVQVGCMKEWFTIKHNLWGLNIINLSV